MKLKRQVPIVFMVILLPLMVIACSDENQPTPTATVPNTPELELNPTIHPTLTPLITPTFSTAAKREILEELVASNGGCDLPCFWGITIGETNFYEAAEILIPLAEYFTLIDSTSFSGTFNVSGDMYKNINLSFERGRNNIVNGIGYAYNFVPISEYLDKFGPPDQIYYSGPVWFPDDYLEFVLFLFYEDEGILVSYGSMVLLDKLGSQIRICDLETSLFEYDLTGYASWNTGETLSFEEMTQLPLFSSDNYDDFIAIELISNFTPESFYQNFLNLDPECLIIDQVEYENQINY